MTSIYLAQRDLSGLRIRRRSLRIPLRRQEPEGGGGGLGRDGLFPVGRT